LLHVFIRILGIICGLILWKGRSKVKIVPVFAASLLTVFVFFNGDDLWKHYATYENFTGRVTPRKFDFQVDGLDQNGTLITNRTFENKVVLLDFWNTRCGFCFEQFPILQAFYERQKNNPSIGIFAVNKPLEEDRIRQAFEMIEEHGYTFPVLFPSDQDLPEKYGVVVYPTTLVLDANSKVVYRGELKSAISMIESELK